MTTKDLLLEYPIRQHAWSYVEETDTFVSEDSTLRGTYGANGYRDPWNRPFPNSLQSTRDTIRDNEGEIVGWKFVTTVDGYAVKLIIFND